MGVYLRDKIWWMCYKLPTGEYVRESTDTTNKKTAEDIYAKQRVAIAENRYLDIRRPSPVSFNELADLYLERHAKPKKKSWKECDVVYLRRLKCFFGHKRLSEITQEMVEEYIAVRRASIVRKKGDGSPQYLSPAGLNRELACLKTMFNKAVEWGKVTVSPCARVKKLKEDNKRTRFLSEDEMKRLAEFASPELRQILMILIHTGMRKGELQNLKWMDLDFNQNLITIAQSKNGKVRYIPMNVAVKNVLLQRRLSKESQTWVFAGMGRSPYTFRKAFETARKSAGLEDVRIHDLRHTFASYLCMSGADLITVKELLGHSSLSMTERYSHLTNRHRADAVARLERLPINHVTIMSQSGKEEESKEFEKIVSRIIPAS